MGGDEEDGEERKKERKGGRDHYMIFSKTLEVKKRRSLHSRIVTFLTAEKLSHKVIMSSSVALVWDTSMFWSLEEVWVLSKEYFGRVAGWMGWMQARRETFKLTKLWARRRRRLIP